MLFAPNHLLLAADLNSLLSILFILFSLIVYVINHVAAKGQDAAKNQPRPRQPQPDPTEDEIEAFLRRTTRKQGEPAGRGQQPQRQQASGQPFGGQQRQGQRGGQRAGGTGRGAGRQNQGMPSQNMPSQASMGAPVQGRLVQQPQGQSPGGLSEQLEKRTGFSSLEDVGSKFPTLQSSLEQIDEMAEARLHSTFDHTVGNLGGALLSTSDDDRIYGSTISDSSTEGQEQPPVRNSIVDMIRSPEGIRNAIIMQEILRPRSLD